MHRVVEQFQRFKIQTQLVVYYIAFVLFTLSTLVYFSYKQAVTSIQTTTEDKLQLIAASKKDSLDRWVNDQQKNAIFLASLPDLRSLSGELLHPNSSIEEKDVADKELT